MKNYWQQLKPRERMLMMIGGGVFSILMLYVLALEPLWVEIDQLTLKVQKQKTDVQHLKAMAKEIRQLQNSGSSGSGAGHQGQSLLVLVDRTSKQLKLSKSVSRIEPDGSARVRVWLENSAFDDLSKWIAVLESKYNVIVETAVIDKTASAGRVNARMVFVEGGA